MDNQKLFLVLVLAFVAVLLLGNWMVMDSAGSITKGSTTMGIGLKSTTNFMHELPDRAPSTINGAAVSVSNYKKEVEK